MTHKATSLRGCINLHCRDCIYDKTNGGTWRQQVQACTVNECALYQVRPVTTKRRPNAEGVTHEVNVRRP